jgi:PAS domain S-box-containing protein
MTQTETDVPKEIEEHVRFKTLLAGLSAHFVNLPPERVDHEILDAQRRIVETLGLDRSALWQLVENEPGRLRLTHLYQPGLPAMDRGDPTLLLQSGWARESAEAASLMRGGDPREYFPWVLQHLLRGDVILISRLDDLPGEAGRDRENLRQIGTKAVVMVPLSVGGPVFGALTFAMGREERAWSPELVEGFQLIAHVVANALARRRSDEVLRESEARFRQMADASPVMIWMSGPDKGCTYFNKGWLDFAGRTLEQELGNGWAKGVHPDEFQRCVDTYGKAFDARERFSMEYRLRRHDGEYRWILDIGQPRFAAGNQFEGYIGSCIDITAIKDLEGQLRVQLREIQELKRRLEEENISLRQEIRLQHQPGDIVGESAAMRKVLAQAEQVAPTGSTVLILGETGTGKELLARAIHRWSGRADRALVTANCASLPPTLIESELFGRERGAYTGALTRMVGRFEVADGSTLFLDEVGELPLEVQAKLLRILQDGHLERLGSTKTLRVDVRVIAATNRDLEREVAEDRFRKDLYYRLNVFPIVIPPLRERPEDIPLLVWTFVEEFGKKMGKRIESIPKGVMEALQGYAWPGNARELRNIIEHAMIISRGGTLEVRIPTPTRTLGEPAAPRRLQDIDRRHILSVLEKSGWRVAGPGGAAKILGMKRSTLQARMRKLGIERPNT